MAMGISQTSIIAYALDRAPGGIGRYSRELIHALCRVEPDLHILAAGPAPAVGRSTSLPGSALLPGLMTLGQLEIGWAVRRSGLKLVHDPTGTCPLLLAGARRVVTIHDVFPYVAPQTSAAAEKLIYRLWLPLALRQVDMVITDSLHSKEDILRCLPVRSSQLTVIPAAAGTHFRPMSPAEVQPALQRHGIDFPYILYVGSIEPRKNLLRLLEAYACLRQSTPRWKLVIVGARNFWKSSPVVETVERLDLKPYVHFTGFVEEADLPALYNGADLFVFPSLYEGFGLPVLEAMSCGTPVVTSNLSSLPEVAGDAALMIDPYDVNAITTAMQRILEDAALAEDLRARGLARAREFSWERTARETLAVYQKVLGES